MTPNTTALDIIIVTAPGCRRYLRACLDSIEAHPLTTGPVRVWVVDNNSDDDTAELVEGRPGVHWLPQRRNLGFARANNVGIANADAELILFLNPDTEVGAGVLDACVERMRSDPRIAILGCRLVDCAGVADPNAKRTFPSFGAAVARLSGWDRIAGPAGYHTPGMRDLDCGPIDAVSGAFMMARLDLISQLGGFDKGYWMYGEDLDLCRRAKAEGFGVWYEGTVATLHVGGCAAGSVRRAKPTVAFHHAMLRYYRRHHAGSKLGLDLIVYCGIGARLILALPANLVRRRWRAYRSAPEYAGRSTTSA